MLAPTPRSPDVEYSILYGLSVFDCKSLRATLQPSACAANWAANRNGSICVGCRLGSIHAGRTETPPPPPKQPCIRCNRHDDRLIGRLLCRGCFNRTREVARGTNGKGQRPVLAGALLRESFAIASLPDAAGALASLYRRRGTTSNFSAQLKRACLPGLPRLEILGRETIWFEGITSGAEELSRALERLLPGAKIIDFELQKTFAERWSARS